MPVCSEGEGGWLQAAGSSPAALCTQGSSSPRKGRGCSGWSQVPAGLGLFLESCHGAESWHLPGGKGFGQGLSCVIWHSGVHVGSSSSQSH